MTIPYMESYVYNCTRSLTLHVIGSSVPSSLLKPPNHVGGGHFIVLSLIGILQRQHLLYVHICPASMSQQNFVCI